MHSWRERLRAALRHAGMDAATAEEIVAELADHSDEIYARAIRDGSSPDAAVSRALAEVPDWSDPGKNIRRARQGGVRVSQDMKTIVIPGVGATCAAAVAFFVVSRFLSLDAWADPRPARHVLAATTAVLFCAAVGALGAAWSRRAGGRPFDRAIAGLLPLLAILAIVVPALVLDALWDLRAHPYEQPFSLQVAKFGLIMLIPAASFLAGTLPFLRTRRP